jgi:hypothetical protein
MPCEPSSLVTLASNLHFVPPPQLLAMQTYLLAYMAGGSTSPQTLITNSRCFLCLSPAQLQAIKTYLLCYLAGLSSCSVPDAPTSFANTAVGASTASFSWSASANPDMDFYLVAYAIDPPGPTPIFTATASASDRSTTVTGLGPSDYFVKIYARDSAFCVSAASNQVHFFI